MRLALPAAAALLGTLCVEACTPPPPANSPIVVAAAEEPAPDAAETPAAAPKPAPFETFLAEFRADYLESPKAVERHVSPSLGLFLVTTPDEFERPSHHRSFHELVIYAEGWEPFPKELTCGSDGRPWVWLDGGFPEYSCKLQRYLTTESCTMGGTRSNELLEVIRLSGVHRLVTPEPVAKLTQHAVEIEPRITHYAFDTEANLGLMFGEVDGAFRLLYVRRVFPCSA